MLLSLLHSSSRTYILDHARTTPAVAVRALSLLSSTAHATAAEHNEGRDRRRRRRRRHRHPHFLLPKSAHHDTGLPMAQFLSKRNLVTPSLFAEADHISDNDNKTNENSETTVTLNRDTCSLSELIGFPGLHLAPPPSSASLKHLAPGQRVVAVGDIHGDYQALQQMLTVAGVYDAKTDAWIGGDTICVQVGDIMDRGPTELACWHLLCRLSHEAKEAGGALIVLYGNHEVLNALGLFHYTTGGAAEYDHYLGKPLDFLQPSLPWRRQFAGNQPARWAACEPGGLLASSLWQHLQVAVVVGRTVCVHAGLTADHVQAYGGSLDRLNQAARRWILSMHHGQNYNTLDDKTVKPESIIHLANARARAASQALPLCLGGGNGGDAESPIWMRDYSNFQPDAQAQQLLDRALDAVGDDVHRMVMGHTPQPRINSALQAKAWRIDVGVSRGMGQGTPEVLEIIHGEEQDELTVLTAKGRIPAENRASL